MDTAPTKIHHRIRVGGIKLSPELVQFIYTGPSQEKCLLTPALESIAGQHINITFLSLSASENTISTTLCVEAENHIAVQGLLKAVIHNSRQFKTIPSVGTLTIFPHRNSITLLGKIIQSFAINTLPVYGLCTSISAISIITDYSSLQRAITALENIVELPDNHAPFRQEFTIRQISL